LRRPSSPESAITLVLASATIALVLARTALSLWENTQLLETSRREALTDSLTGLANRRKLLTDLEVEIEAALEGEPRLLCSSTSTASSRTTTPSAIPQGMRC
jgi:predicted signal transduction protein with EAL and GGDEF domain